MATELSIAKNLMSSGTERSGDPDLPEDDAPLRLPRPRRALKQGFSTGTAATAAARAALMELLGLPCPGAMPVRLPRGAQPGRAFAQPRPPGLPGRGPGHQRRR